MEIQVRSVAREDVPAYLSVLPFANGLPSWEPAPAAWHAGPEAWPQPNPPATSEQMASWADQVIADDVHPQAAFVNGKLVGASAMISFEITVPGLRQVPMGGVSATGVMATHRRRGLLRAMMQSMFDDALERGEALAGLSASEGSIYGRFGFSPATWRTRWEIDRSQAQLLGETSSGSLEITSADTAREVWPRVHDAWRRTRVGELRARSGRWSGLHDRSDGVAGPMRYVIHRDGAGVVDGIANYRIPWSADPDQVGTLVVEAMCALTPEAERGMWGLLLDFDLTRRVAAAARPLDEPLRWMLQNPRAMRITRHSDNLWLRLLDVSGALEARTYRVHDVMSFRIESDPMCPGNEGTWRLDGGPEGAQCTRSEAEADLVVEPQALASLYLGGMSASHLARAGLIRSARPEVIERLASMFHNDPEPHNSFGF